MIPQDISVSKNPLDYPAIMNQIFEIERKVAKLTEQSTLHRHIAKIKEYFAEFGLTYQDPTGEYYNDTRTDCDAQILAGGSGPLKIIETIKPIVRYSNAGLSRIIQRAVVIAQAENK
jgi:hypothetical protein